MAQAYSVFALHGDRATPFVIEKVTSPTGEIVVNEPRIEHGKLSAAVCDQMDTLMREVVLHGTGSAAADVPDAHGKTGTTSDNRDAWFCGYADGLIGVGWVGNARKRKAGGYEYLPMDESVFGGTVTVPFWAEIMDKAEGEFGYKNASMRSDSDGANSYEARVHAKKPSTKPVQKAPAPAMAPAPDENQPDKTDNATGDGGSANGGSQIPPEPNTDQDNQDSSGGADKQTPPADNSGDQGPTDAPKPNKPTAKVSYVTVSVCAESGKLATRYCPQTVSRKFRKGAQPTEYCPIHKG
jgi:penicillin-binding protein 1A